MRYLFKIPESFNSPEERNLSIFFDVPNLNIYLQIAVTIISIAVVLFRTRNMQRRESLLEIITTLTIGLSGWFTIISGLFGHIIYADEVASGIGWPLNSGFQMELGFASIGIGIIGFLGFWKRAYWFPFVLIKLIFGWGAGLTHLLHEQQFNNLSPSNTGLIVYWDFLFPLFMFILYLLVRRQSSE